MIKCRVFKTDWNNPELHSAVREFNSFCLDNPDIEVIKIDTVTVGPANGDVNIYLYYNKKEPTISVCTGNPMLSDFKEVTVRNFKPGDKIKYLGSDRAYYGTIIATGNSCCLIQLDTTHEVIETSYTYIFKQE